MTNYPNFQYIIIKSNGNIVNYYFHSDFGICSSLLSASGKWNNAVSNAEDAKKDYSINLDIDNTIYVIYRNKNGAIKLIIQNGSQTKSINVLQSKTNPDYNMYPKVIPINDSLHTFFIVDNSGKKIICHQNIKDGKPQQPVAVDYINYNDQYIPYTVVSCKSKILLLYTTSSEGKDTAGVRVFEQSTEKWGKFVPLTKPADIIYSPVMSCYKNKIVLAYVKKYEDATYIVKRNFSDISLTLSTEQETVKCPNPDILPQIYLSEDTEIIYWRDDRQVQYIVDSGNSENITVKYLDFNERNSILHFNVVANIDNQIIQANLLPGNFSNGLTLSFIKTPASVTNTAYSSEKTTHSGEFKALEAIYDKIIGLEKSIRLINEKISSLEKKLGS